MKVINSMQDFVEWLEGLADGTEELLDAKYGLCYQIGEAYDLYITDDFKNKWGDLDEMDDIFESWDKVSGIEGYPVPAPDSEDAVEGITCPEEIYYKLNKWEGAYGDLRKELCRHVANEFRKLIEE